MTVLRRRSTLVLLTFVGLIAVTLWPVAQGDTVAIGQMSIPVDVSAAVLGVFLLVCVAAIETSASQDLEARLAKAIEQTAEALAAAKRFVGALGQARSLITSAIVQILSQIARELDLGADARLTLYKESGGCLERIARYSQNPLLRSSGRSRIPVEGIAGSAVKHGGPIRLDGLPSTSQRLGWLVAQRESGLSNEVAFSLTMHSRCYLAYGIRSLDDQIVGVLVLESTDPDGIPPTDSVNHSVIRQRPRLWDLALAHEAAQAQAAA